MRYRTKEEEWALPYHILLLLRAEELPNDTCTETLIENNKRMSAKPPTAAFVEELSWLRHVYTHTW